MNIRDRVLSCIRNNPGLTQFAIAKMINEPLADVHMAVRELRVEGLVERDEQ